MKIERVEELRLSCTDEAMVADLLDDVFPVDFGGRSFFQNRHHCRFLVRGEGCLIGHLALSYRAIAMGKQRVDLIGIGDVAVAQQHRRKGVGSALLNAALEEGRQAGADFAALFGDNTIYSKAGFFAPGNRIKHVEMEGARTGARVWEINPWFRVMPLGKRVWDKEVDIDLAGFAF